MSEGTNERHRAERGAILHLLIEDDSDWTLFDSLWRMLDRRGYSVSKDGLTFHLRKYLAQRGYVEIQTARELQGHLSSSMSLDAIVRVRIAPDGLALVNRSKVDTEVTV